MDATLLDLLVCPLSKAPLVLEGDWLYSVDRTTRRKYPVRDGIPIMLVDESQVAEEAEFERIVGQRAVTRADGISLQGLGDIRKS